MPQHVIVVDRESDFTWAAKDRLVVAAKDFVTDPGKWLHASAHVINLCGNYGYQSLGYYCSLLAEARGQRVIPAVEAMLDLHWKRLLRIALPEVSELIGRTFTAGPEAGSRHDACVFFGHADDARLADAGRRIFELFRCPLLALELKRRGSWTVAALRPMSIRELRPEQRPQFADALNRYARAGWRRERPSVPPRYSLAILHDPAERLPPSDARALNRFVRVAETMGVEAELITRADYGHLLEYDALFIRETTALDHHTYRFARKAEAEGMPVIDDPRSILRCTNKIYLAELLEANGIPGPKTLILDRQRLGRIEAELGFPAVVKVPDSSFSRGVFKVESAAELEAAASRVLSHSDLVIAQEYLQTPFDWRVGILDRNPLFVCQYYMARGHWQIVRHGANNQVTEGAARTVALADAPERVVRAATEAASLIGDGLYGVDVKETPAGVFVVEVNDNPNVDAGVEDAVLKDDLYRAIVQEFIHRLERRTAPNPAKARVERRP